MSFQANCPACGAPVVFDITTSIATVCGSCGTVVGRGDGALENFGQVADLVQTDSPLQLGLRGKYRGVPFEITGRSQSRHAAGGVWDEWYVAFREGQRWGWLAEAQGRLYLTFEKDVPDNAPLPPLDELAVDEPVVIPAVGTLRVAEIGTATAVSAAGELPFAFVPDAEQIFADLSGAGRKFATIDYSDEQPHLYVGGEVTFEQLGIAERVRDREKELRRTAALQVSCPNCAGSLELQAPDQTKRVACPFCGSLLAADQGNLRFLEALGGKKVEPLIPLGTVGHIAGEMVGEAWPEPLDFRVIGFMERKVRYDGTTYRWHEYLLYRPRTPFHWLICSEGHWNFGKPVSSGDVEVVGNSASYDGKNFRIFDRSKPKVGYVLGEFYWEVRVGERTRSADYIRPPWMLSREVSIESGRRNSEGLANAPAPPEQQPAEPIFDVPDDGSGPAFLQAVGSTLESLRSALYQQSAPEAAGEVNYTLSTYFPVEHVKTAFGIDDLPQPRSVAPNQPWPHKKLYAAGLGVLAVALLLVMLVYASASRREVYRQSFTIAAGATKIEFPSQSVAVRGWKNLQIQAAADRWVYVDGELISEKDNSIHKFGVSSGETVFLSAIPAGNYKLKLNVESQKPPRSAVAGIRPPVGIAGQPAAAVNQPPHSYSLRIRQGIPRGWHVVLLLLGLASVPVLAGVHQLSFESRRWQDSDYSPFASED